jgi:hypothetical protein
LVHSQAGAFGWPVADARPRSDQGDPRHRTQRSARARVEFVGAPSWFKEGPLSLKYGITSVPLNYMPAVTSPSDLAFVKDQKADAPDKVVYWQQKAPARQLPNLQKMPILVLSAEASYHAPYDHCTVRYLQQAGVKPSVIRLRMWASTATAT